ncbi:tRNA pseudouridine synthase [Metschnikowia bicuspidata var. bicuspidata NRRL YB-4993]|uniref:tRNA pseudouridine synthase n=1 Tax=Metschnikowia bicuspidata var. bicuspidata NRRL YB-4993 TaxID=869754 RepID=A0A1A0HHI5_9ASCO|nr:tRNA pseudouridine synthase [Metschnikowia bicuspidata var. bicuspidata NRRL YB-4993]OBA23465.1 tRNA pseudouridine synthase [Metschnikowia bicuspidata var. bicuspidata NRRL YB-4993]
MSLSKQPVTSACEYEKWLKTQLIRKIQELENGGTSPAAGQESAADSSGTGGDKDTSKTALPLQKKRKFDFTRFQTRFVAFRFAYMGWNYNGLNYQYEPTPLPTVEEVILQAMSKAKLVTDVDPVASGFSRCGRTDKGVSALNQVISLNVRSSLTKEQQMDPANDLREIPYVSILNALLPLDIRITAVSLRPPPNFDARFSCSYRHYKYLFSKKGLDLEKMEEAAKMYEGVHDFRNFCKIDGSKQITNYFREVYSANIVHQDGDFYVFDLKGSAFLWHQVRCMVAVLFLVGQGLESPSVVKELLDIQRYPSKPLFEMANDLPLVLYDCVFPEMEWLSAATDFDGAQKLKLMREHGKFNGLLLEYQLKAHVASMVGEVFVKETVQENSEAHPNAGAINLGDGKGRNYKTYVPISQRDLGDDVATVNARHKEKQKKKGNK